MTLQESWDILVAAAAARALYPIAGVVLWLALQIAKNRAPQWLPKIPDGWKFVIPLAVGALTGFVDGWQSGLTWKGSLLRAGYAVFALALPAMGWQSGLKESVLGGAGVSLFAAKVKEPITPKPPVLPLLMLCLGLLLLPGATCAQAKPIIRTVNNIAADWCVAHYSTLQGLSVEDALKTFCTGEKALKPWLDLILMGQKNGVGKMGVGAGECEVTDAPDAAVSATDAGGD